MATCLFLDNYEYMIELLNERVDVNGCSKFIVTENEIVNKIVFDESNNEIYIDGVEIDISSESVCEPPELQAYGEFTYYGTTYQNVTLEQKVRNTTQSVLFVALQALFSPASAVLFTIAGAIIQWASSRQSNSYSVYVTRVTEMYTNYIAYRYTDYYSVDGTTVQTDQFEYWQ